MYLVYQADITPARNNGLYWGGEVVSERPPSRRLTRHRKNPTDSHGTAATIMVPKTSAIM
jgi:hypothetical protein